MATTNMRAENCKRDQFFGVGCSIRDALLRHAFRNPEGCSLGSIRCDLAIHGSWGGRRIRGDQCKQSGDVKKVHFLARQTPICGGRGEFCHPYTRCTLRA